MSTNKPDTKAILGGLKDFQRQTVDYVFERLYGKEGANRFLIADEVGLGKTLVARGVVARAIERLWEEKGRRIDIVYICANRDIAAQNIARLNVTDQEERSFASRLTLLPLHLKDLDERLNFISFTPGTSFDLRSRTGIARERALIYHMLRKGWNLSGVTAKNLLQADCSGGAWDSWIDYVGTEEINPGLAQGFMEALAKAGVRPRFDAVAALFPRRKEWTPADERGKRSDLIGEMRRILARSCLGQLQPDIIILDEFQRFKNLLSDEDEVGQLAKDLFDYPQAKVLLLSATPYKMYTMSHESGEDDHYADFLKTAQFLFKSDKATEGFKQSLAEYRLALFDLGGRGTQRLQAAKQSIETQLRAVMVRTERLGVTTNRDGMISEKGLAHAVLEPGDVRSYMMVDKVAQSLEVHDALEYWKSAPYLLNLMDGTYAIKKKFREAASTLKKDAVRALQNGQDRLLPWELIKRYKSIDPGNAKLRVLLENTVEKGAWQLLWVPPSLPYYDSPGSPSASPELRDFTKALSFSSWKVVPKAVAALVSYEAERRVMELGGVEFQYPDLKQRKPLIQFHSDKDGLRGMNFFTLIYPCFTLAHFIDPLKIALSLVKDGHLPSEAEVLAKVRERVSELMVPILAAAKSSGQRSDGSWYVAALARLDRRHHSSEVKQWLALSEKDDGEMDWAGMLKTRRSEGESRFKDHVNSFWTYFKEDKELGEPPADLLDVLTNVAVASPAVVSLRALLRIATLAERADSGGPLMASAAWAALGFRSLFNLPESITIIRGLRKGSDEVYWKEVLEYCSGGNLQAVMDEYVHMLRESLGQTDKAAGVAAWNIASEIHTAVSLRTVNLDFDEIVINQDKVSLAPHSLRCRFALAYGINAKGEEDDEETRADQVRSAFNSPFRPFVLASTSIGQEGLDFHPYCHSIYHWNLPNNPVDLEQREGRIHRYKGHVIRRNVARSAALSDVAERYRGLSDPWGILFTLAKELQPEQNDLTPYWIFEREGGLKINRYVPMFPLSRDSDHLNQLKKTLAVYRMVFGMSRQDDLAAYLCSRLGRDIDLQDLMSFRIDLCPTPSNSQLRESKPKA